MRLLRVPRHSRASREESRVVAAAVYRRDALGYRAREVRHPVCAVAIKLPVGCVSTTGLVLSRHARNRMYHNGYRGLIGLTLLCGQ